MRKTFLTLFVCWTSYAALAQALQFEKLKEGNVLDKHPVVSIAQDSRGRIWFGGEYNLFMYHSAGVSNVTTQHPNFARIGYIVKLAFDDLDNLIIGTSNSLHIYNTTRNTKLHVDHDFRDFQVYDLKLLDQKLFVCSSKGLFIAEQRDPESYKLLPVIDKTDIFTIASLGDNRYAASTAKGITMFENSTSPNSPKVILDLPFSKNFQDFATCIYVEGDLMWVGTKHHGLFKHNMRQGQTTNFTESNSALPSNNIRKITTGPVNQLLIGTLKGLSSFDRREKFTNYRHNPNIPKSISQNSVYDVYRDKQDIVWIGTYFGGLNFVYPYTNVFTIYSSTSPLDRRLSSDIVSSLAESEAGYWIGTEETGLNFLDKKKKHITTYPQFTLSGLIKDLHVKNEKLYVAQYAGGYSIVDLQRRTKQNYLLDPDTSSLNNNVFSILKASRDTILLGTNDGLYIKSEHNIHPQKVNALPQGSINQILENSKGDIFIRQAQDVYLKRGDTDEYHILKSLESIPVNSLSVDHYNGGLWISSMDKIYFMSTDHDPVIQLQVEENMLGAILHREKALWITSEKGLIYHDTEKNYTNILTEHDGLPATNLTNAKLFLTKEGRIFLSTFHGLVSFDPNQIQFNRYTPTVLLNGVNIHERQLENERIAVLPDQQNRYQITLDHDQNYVTFNFSSSNLITPQKNQYRFKLNGIDKDWVTSSTPSVRYTSIPTGKHELLVYASNNDRVWSTEPLIVKLTIKPPFWKTWWAYGIYLIVIFLMIYFTTRFIIERQLLIKSEYEHEKKLRFFTRISHEIRTPLTLISAPLEDILAETANQPITHQKVSRLRKNTNKLLSIVNELLDFKKFDDRKQHLHKSNVSFREYIEDFFYLFSDAAKVKNINYYIKRLDDVGILAIDAPQFDKIMFNLLSNAIKYTNDNGTVYLELINQNDDITVKVVDNGIGITDTDQFLIFEEYYREHTADGVIGTGIGLALTKEIVEQHGGKISCKTITSEGTQWTSFRVKLKKDQVHAEDTLSNTTSEKIVPVTEKPSKPISPISLSLHETILIVEDNKEVMEIVKNLFEDTYHILICDDGIHALEMAQHHIPDIIISDIMLPGKDGIQLCNEIKTSPLTSHIPVILLTAIADEHVKTEGLKYGANFYITKPFDKTQLYHIVNNLLNINKTNREEFRIDQPISSNQVDQQFIRKLDFIIEENLTNPALDVSFISDSMGMSAPVLYKKLKAISDLSINNYVKLYRLNKAKGLLNGDLHINEIAYSVGFSDRKYFSKEFKKAFGQSPSEFMKKTE